MAISNESPRHLHLVPALSNDEIVIDKAMQPIWLGFLSVRLAESENVHTLLHARTKRGLMGAAAHVIPAQNGFDMFYPTKADTQDMAALDLGDIADRVVKFLDLPSDAQVVHTMFNHNTHTIADGEQAHTLDKLLTGVDWLDTIVRSQMGL